MINLQSFRQSNYFIYQTIQHINTKSILSSYTFINMFNININNKHNKTTF